MTVLTELDKNFTEKVESEDLLEVRAALENATNVLREADTNIQRIVDNGNYAKIPAQLTAQFNLWRGLFQTATTAIEANPNIQDILNWRPPQA